MKAQPSHLPNQWGILGEQLYVIVSASAFEAEVLKASGVVLVGFWADWSGACHVMAPVVEALARRLEGRMRVLLLDIDRLPGLKRRYGVESVPTLLFFREGQPVERVVGTARREALAEKAESVLLGRSGEGA